jgi:hypothetical protein
MYEFDTYNETCFTICILLSMFVVDVLSSHDVIFFNLHLFCYSSNYFS